MRSQSWIRSLVLVITLLATETALPLNAASPSLAHAQLAPGVPCTRAVCSIQLGVNPGLLAGKPFACLAHPPRFPLFPGAPLCRVGIAL